MHAVRAVRARMIATAFQSPRMFQDQTPEPLADLAALAGPTPDWLDALVRYFESLLADNTLGDYLVAGGVAVLVTAVLLGVKLAVLFILRRQGGDNPRSRRAVFATAAARTWTLYLILLGITAGAGFLALPGALTNGLAAVTLVIFFLQVGAWTSALITGFTERYSAIHGETDPQATTGLSLLRLVGRIAVWSIVLLLILDNLGVDVTALVAGLGIGGIAIGLAAQNILGDLFGSLAIVMDKPFVRGDFIILGPDHMGTVEQIGLKTTRIRALSGEQLVVANSDLLTSRIRNYKRMWERRIVFKLGVTYQTPHAKIERIPGIIREIIEAQEGARYDRSHFSGYGDFALLFESVWFVSSPDYNTYMDIQQAIYLEIHRQFEAEGIEFAYPTQTVFVEGMGGGRTTE